MLNLAFSRAALDFDDSQYKLPDALITKVIHANRQTESGAELRLQEVFTFEVWNSLRRLGISAHAWPAQSLLDICCGTGFLSYHLARKTRPERLILLDISLTDVAQAWALFAAEDGAHPPQCLVSDALQMGLAPGACDVIIGNSFLHHFHDVPEAIRRIFAWLKPGGLFVTLHEPTPGAVPLESGRLQFWLRYLMFGRKALEYQRYTGAEVVYGGAGSDVWMFKPGAIQALFGEAGFVGVRVRKQRIARSLVAARLNLELTISRPRLEPREEFLLKLAIQSDNLLSVLLPQKLFGSFCLSARKPSS